MAAFSHCLSAALVVVCASLVHAHGGSQHFRSSDDAGKSSDDVSKKSPREFQPQTIDEVLRRASGGTAALNSPVKGRAMTTDVLDGMDMMLSRKQYSRLYSGVQTRGSGRTVATPWTHGVIPYEIKDGDFNAEELSWIRRAMDHWELTTCVEFRPATPSDSNKIEIHTGEGCWAHLGMEGGTQEVNLDPLCFWRGTIEHEFGHTLGMIHEHQRPQRDGYIKVDYYAAKRIFVDQLTKYSRGSEDKFGLDYDYLSVMHYGKRAFSGNGYSQTFYPRDPAQTDVIGLTLKPSFLDAKFINLMYHCADRCTNGRTCPSDCYLTAECDCMCKDDFKETCEDTDPACPQRARDGDCNENLIFMHTKCRLSCGICTRDDSEAHFICTNSDPRCQQWADEGECNNNPNYMHRSCPLACGDCAPGDKYSVDGPCRDSKGSCRQQAEQGQCDKDPGTMLKDCTKSCDFCPNDLGKDPSDKPGCVDFDTVCKFRAENGLCHKHYALMSQECRQACGNCNGSISVPPECVETDQQCRNWALGGECDSNPDFMLDSCRRACSPCPGLNRPDKCVDYDLDCPEWADIGECEFNPVWMEKNCRKSCFVCTEDGTSNPDGDCQDSNPNCPDWADYGECDKNPGYMLEGCKKSCNTCRKKRSNTMLEQEKN